MPITRRQLLAMGAAAAVGRNPAIAQTRRSRMGVGSASYMFRIMTERRNDPRARIGESGFFETLNFLDYCHALGAGGVQCELTSLDSGYAKKVRQKCEEHGMYFEATLSLPQTEADVDGFNDALKAVRQAGASVVRAVMLTGRRYETFDSLAAWEAFATQSWKRLTLAEPALRKNKIFLALENHKDWRIDEMLGVLQRISSEYVGVCVDVGNNIALLEDPLDLAQAFAPYAKSVHLKDMALEAYEDGFLLSEVPFGAGYLDLKRIVEILQQANPALQISLEMITRDPLPIPVFTDKYWATMPTVPGRDLAHTLRTLRDTKWNQPLPRYGQRSPDQQLKAEDENVKRCLAYAVEKLNL